MSYYELQQIIETPTIEQMKEYFKFKYRGAYYDCVKYEVIKHLKEEKLTHSKIGEIVFGKIGRHDMVNHYLTKFNPIDNQAKENWCLWINTGLYPKSNPTRICYKAKTVQDQAIMNSSGFVATTKTILELVANVNN